MANIKKIQEDAMAYIDTSKAMIDKVLAIMEIVSVNPFITSILSNNSIGFSIQLLKHLGIKREELENFLSGFLTRALPALEISVKSVLLTNLKHMISCSSDPRIPEQYRKRHKEISNYNTSQEYGIDINIESIDFFDKLSINPLSEEGNCWYFGLDGVDDSYKFARADDFDAFLWFVIHKGKFPNSASISKLSDIGIEHGTPCKKVAPRDGDGSLLSAVEVMYDSDDSSSILLGNTFKYEGDGHIISMCIDRKLGDSGNTIKNTLVPVSDDWSSVNWYARRADQLGKNIGFGWHFNNETKMSEYSGKGRNFSKERALCNLQYIDQSSSDAPITGLVNNKFRFTILPKPYIHIPRLSKGEPPWRFKKMLFNDKGEFDSNGKYTFVAPPTETFEDGEVIFTTSNGNTVRMNMKSGDVEVDNKNELVKEIMECYPGLTVYEFNYDYVMSIKLFDAKVMLHTLFESLFNTNIGGTIKFNFKHQEQTEIIKQIIKNIIESDESSLNECYYTFDNSKYESLLRKAEEKRARQERFGDTTHEIGLFTSVSEILKEYDSNAELHKQESVLHRAIKQASVIVSEGVDEADRPEIEFKFVFDLIEALTTALVNSVLSPKVLLLLEVNQKLMGGTWETFSVEDLMKTMETIIVSITKEVSDLITQELYMLIAKALEPIIQTIGSALVREQLDNYSEAILELVKYYKTYSYLGSLANSLLGIKTEYENTTIDNVDYADINNEGEQPSTNNKC